MRERIEVIRGDITKQQVDAIVNAANAQLLPGGGVCGAIHRAAGRELAHECAQLGGCETGKAKITRGYRLPARYVIHAVGPVWHGGTHGEPEQLAGAYRASLELAVAHDVDSIAFPAISTGIYGYPLEPATRIAVGETLRFLQGSAMPDTVVFVCHGDDSYRTYQRVVAEMMEAQ